MQLQQQLKIEMATNINILHINAILSEWETVLYASTNIN